MTFCPQFPVTPRIVRRIVRQIVAIDRTTRFLNAVPLEPDWIAKLKHRIENPVHPFRVHKEPASQRLQLALSYQTLRYPWRVLTILR